MSVTNKNEFDIFEKSNNNNKINKWWHFPSLSSKRMIDHLLLLLSSLLLLSFSPCLFHCVVVTFFLYNIVERYCTHNHKSFFTYSEMSLWLYFFIHSKEIPPLSFATIITNSLPTKKKTCFNWDSSGLFTILLKIEW